MLIASIHFSTTNTFCSFFVFVVVVVVVVVIVVVGADIGYQGNCYLRLCYKVSIIINLSTILWPTPKITKFR